MLGCQLNAIQAWDEKGALGITIQVERLKTFKGFLALRCFKVLMKYKKFTSSVKCKFMITLGCRYSS